MPAPGLQLEDFALKSKKMFKGRCIGDSIEVIYM